MTKWLAGIGLGGLGLLLGVSAVYWAASQGNEFSTRWFLIPFFLPLLGFVLGFIHVDNFWPIKRITTRLLFCAVPAFLCALAMCLSNLMVSFTWNRGFLPPEKASLAYLVFHPDEVPPLKIRETQPFAFSSFVKESSPWYQQFLAVFLVAGIFAFVLTCRKKSSKAS